MVLTKRFGPTEIDVLDSCLQCVQGRRRYMALQITTGTGTGSWFAKMLEGNRKRYNHLSTKKQGLWSLLSLLKKLGDDLISHMNYEPTKISHDLIHEILVGLPARFSGFPWVISWNQPKAVASADAKKIKGELGDSEEMITKRLYAGLPRWHL